MTDVLISATTLFFDPIAALVLIWVLLVDLRPRHAPMSMRIGVALCAAGLLAQSYRSMIAFFTGEFPPEAFLPWWVLKDWGLIVLALAFAWAKWRGRYEF